MTATVRERQTAFDVALQYFGSAEAVFVVAQRLGVSITDRLPAGARFEYSAEEVVDRRVVEYYLNNGIVPTTAVEQTEIPCEGIGHWRIEIDFVIE